MLKQGFTEIESFVSQYDPKDKVVEKSSKKAEEMRDLLGKRFSQILLYRPKISSLSDVEKREFEAINREIERYSIDLNTLKVSIEKLKGLKQLSPDEISIA